jgi:integrase
MTSLVTSSDWGLIGGVGPLLFHPIAEAKHGERPRCRQSWATCTRSSLARRLGHASIQMTADTYGHLFPRGDDGSELAAAEKALMR